MTYDEVKIGMLLQFGYDNDYRMIARKDDRSFDYYRYKDAKLALVKNTGAQFWNSEKYIWKYLKHIKSRKVNHLMIRMLFKKGLY